LNSLNRRPLEAETRPKVTTNSRVLRDLTD
jgi:hypothetical protein